MRAVSVLRLVAVTLLLAWCGSSAAIKVPVSWEASDYEEHASAESSEEDPAPEGPQSFEEWTPPIESPRNQRIELQEEERVPPPTSTTYKPIPIEYFEYPARKPQFAVDVATFHGVPSPHQQYRATPVRPHAPRPGPVLGKHAIPARPIFEPFQTFIANAHDGLSRYVGPVSTNYEVFHPYKAEEPGLKTHYNDPHLEKVKNDVEENKKRLQQCEKDAGEANIESDDYTKTPEQTDRELFGHAYKPNEFEEYRPAKMPHYYSPPPKQQLPHDDLNKKLKYPLNQNYIKIKPLHYQPLRNRLKNLRHRHQNQYGDEKNEYPQPGPRYKQHFAEPPDGYDIYQTGKEHFNRYQNDVDLALNKYSNDYRIPSYGEDETGDLVKNGDQYKNKPHSESEEDDFVPIKMYAQVRKTESIKHLPKEAAFDEAETPEDILNAPRLREAVKSTKAQTIYSEEGYEDKAYDHEGQQKHASNHEGHAGYLKEKEKSGGRYKIPFVQHDFEEGDGVSAGNSYTHKEKYKNEDGRSEDEVDSEISTVNVHENDENDYDLDEAGTENLDGKNLEHTFVPKAVLSLTKDSEKTTIRDENDGTSIKTETEHMRATNNNNKSVKERKITGSKNKNKQKTSSRRKRNVNFEVPELNLDNTYLTEREIIAISRQKLAPIVNKLKIKYPYYFMTNINENSPLKYAENLKYIPKKTKGGTEFYDSRSIINCPDVEPEIDPVPKKLNSPALEETSEVNKEESSEDGSVKEEGDIEQFNRRKRQSDFSTINKSPRLRGLGDKIDCFKEKFFDENPLDNPFFSEDVIIDPEPLKELKFDIYQIKKSNGELIFEPSELNEIFTKENLNETNVDQIHSHNDNTSNITEENNYPFTETTMEPIIILKGISDYYPNLQQSNVYSDIIQNIQSHLQYNKNQTVNQENIVPLLLSRLIINPKQLNESSKEFKVYLNKEDVTIPSPSIRVKRSNQFIYEPYKVIREHQEPDSKKTTTSGNVSPLIKQLQASKVSDHTNRPKEEVRAHYKVQPVKRNVKEKNYTDIHREDRAKHKEQNSYKDFIDVSVDRRRGEPRYELSQLNHKTKYTPVTNTRSLSLEEYKLRTDKMANDKSKDIVDEDKSEEISEESENITDSPTPRSLKPYFDVSAYIPRVRRPLKRVETVTLKTVDKPIKRRHSSNNLDAVRLQESSSEKIHKIIKSKSQPNKKPETTNKPAAYDKTKNTSEDDEEYEEYDEELTTTTRKPVKIKRKLKVRTTTTLAPVPEHDYDYAEEELGPITSTTTTTTTAKPKFKILRRLRKPVNQGLSTSNSTNAMPAATIDINKHKKLTQSPKNNPSIQEKTVKTQKSTMITDSKSYGEEDDMEDTQKEQIDAMIGGRENMKDFIEEFDEPNLNDRGEEARRQGGSERDDEREINSSEKSDARSRLEQVGENDEDDENDGGDGDDRDDGDELPLREDSEEGENEDDSRESISDRESYQPAPINKTSQQNDEIILPIVKKRIMLKRPLPARPESELTGKYRQPSEQTASVPGRLEPLHTYRDKAIAEDVNRLADVEVFDEDIMKVKGPRHGGNYRSEKLIEELDERVENEEEHPRMHGGNLQDTPAPAAAEPRRSAAALLNTLAQAATVLTTTPRYILDPSKRMYYYVDAR